MSVIRVTERLGQGSGVSDGLTVDRTSHLDCSVADFGVPVSVGRSPADRREPGFGEVQRIVRRSPRRPVFFRLLTFRTVAILDTERRVRSASGRLLASDAFGLRTETNKR